MQTLVASHVCDRPFGAPQVTGLQTEKSVVRTFYKALDAPNANLADVIAAHTGPDYLWRGFHPFGELNAAQAAREFWQPLRHSLTSMQRRQDIFFAGENALNAGGTWVVSMGHLMGLFDASWLGIPPTGKLVFLRYCEFNRVQDGKITETAMYFDIPHLMIQAGIPPFPPQTAAHVVQPGPITHDGLLFSPQPPEEGAKTRALIENMIADLGQWQAEIPLEEELRRTWAEDMIWWGPAGIGATYTIPRYAAQHAGPFRSGFTQRSKTTHIARVAEGAYGAFFGWPNFTARASGGFMGMPATDQAGEFRVIDVYRRDGDKLAENWIFIDLLHFWKSQGLDVLARIPSL